MYELEEFEKNARELRRERGSIRKALEDGSLRPVAMQLPKVPEYRRRKADRCSTGIKFALAVLLLSLITMLCYAVWRIRDIEEPSEAREDDYDYRIIGSEEIGNNATDNTVDGT